MKLLTLLAAPFPALVAAAPAHAQAPALPDSAVRTLLCAALPHDARVGTVVGLLEPDGRRRVIAVGGPGFDGRTRFELGSVTKVFTGVLLADMVVRGEVRLDQPVVDLLPRGTRVPAAGATPITLAALATHTAGLPYMPANFRPRDRRDPFADYGVPELYAFLAGYRPPRAVGAAFEYSNVGAALLGHALARRLGTSYDAAVTSRVLGPLGLRETSATVPEVQHGTLAVGYDAAGRALPPWHLGAFAAAGALRASADDLLRFLAANLMPGAAPALRRALPLAQAVHYRGPDGQSMGLGWSRERTPDGRQLLVHGGRTGGFATFVALDLTRRRGVVVLRNTPGDVPALGLSLLARAAAPTPATAPAAERGVAVDNSAHRSSAGRASAPRLCN